MHCLQLHFVKIALIFPLSNANTQIHSQISLSTFSLSRFPLCRPIYHVYSGTINLNICFSAVKCWYCFQGFVRQMRVHTQRAYILYTQVIWITDEDGKKASQGFRDGIGRVFVCVQCVCMFGLVCLSLGVCVCM